ncbi:MAG: hypothetical protein JNL74_04620, partial [Fibrobacteres bacterium]|nr:hypothetical protein [Fibrobacterota bacterium]
MNILSTLFFVALFYATLPAIPSFPGAEGWGSVATGGRGGRVIIVDNLKDAGPGSLRAALCDTGKRIIVFRVSGVINLTSSPVNSFARLFQNIKNSNFTLAGQTSPGGITLTSDVRILGSLAPEYNSTGPKNFIIRFLRLRCTRNADLDCATYPATWDAAQYSDVDSMLIDHCDFSGGDDGTFDITGSKNWTVQWSTITNSTYRCGDHGGTLTAYTPTHHITLHHNLWAHHEVRGSLFHWNKLPAPEYGMIDYYNNVSYNMWDFTLMIQDGGTVNLNCVGNTFVEGPQKHYYSSNYPDYCNHRYTGDIQLQTRVVGFFSDNRHLQENGAIRNVDTAKTAMSCIKTATRFDMGPVTVSPADVAYEQVVHNAGLWYQDSMSRRVENEVRTRTGRHRNNLAPFVNAGPLPPTDTDNDGMPDFWEDAMGLNKNGQEDASADKDGDGYTNIEEYINDLALARMRLPYDNPVNPIPAEWTANPLIKL